MHFRRYFLSLLLLGTLFTGVLTTSHHVHTSSDDHKQTTQCHLCHYMAQFLSEGSSSLPLTHPFEPYISYSSYLDQSILTPSIRSFSERAPPLAHVS